MGCFRMQKTLTIQVPSELKRSLELDAATKGITIRALVLSILSEAGYSIPDDDLRDRRKSDQ